MQEIRKLEGFENVQILSREDLLKIITELIFKLRYKIFYGRFSKMEIERLRVKYDRMFVEVLRVYNEILKDAEIEEIKKRLEGIERRLK